MIVIFGASSDIGRRATARLLDGGARVRAVARDPSTLDPRAERVRGDLSDLPTIGADVSQVVSCAHARFTDQLLEKLPKTVRQIVLTGSAWRYSRVPNPRADEVRRAEAAFLSSGRDGVMLHPTMIYGGTQERNLQRLVSLIRRSPVLPVPGGGRHLVQPIHVDDVAGSIVAALRQTWSGPNVIPIAGPVPMPWREMARACARATNRRPFFLPLPIGPLIRFLSLTEAAGLTLPVRADMLKRFQEDVRISISEMHSRLGVIPRPFDVGLRQALREWEEPSAIGHNVEHESVR
jgi:nucleoside-diphosphate-sugar epimerase